MSILSKYALLLFAAVILTASAATAQDGQLSTHILDINKGEPATGVSISLHKYDDQSRDWVNVTTYKTDKNGRIAGLLPGKSGNKGTYKLRFEVADYFAKQNLSSIYPYIEVVFRIDGDGHYHIPLTLSANGYSTYRGS